MDGARVFDPKGSGHVAKLHRCNSHFKTWPNFLFLLLEREFGKAIGRPDAWMARLKPAPKVRVIHYSLECPRVEHLDHIDVIELDRVTFLEPVCVAVHEESHFRIGVSVRIQMLAQEPWAL